MISRIPEQVLEDQKYQNARTNSGRQNAQVELDSAHRRLVTSMVRHKTEPYKAYTEERELRKMNPIKDRDGPCKKGKGHAGLSPNARPPGRRREMLNQPLPMVMD